MQTYSRHLIQAMVIAIVGFAQAISVESVHAQAIPFDSERWEIEGQEHSVETYLGQEALRLQGGSALLKDVEFTDGVIEFDIAFPPDRSFTGVVWRVQEGGNYEEFYFRPHLSGNPDANQYTPVFNGVSGWQLYAGDGYAVPTEYAFNEWMPVRIVVAGRRAEVYIRDMETPALVTAELKHGLSSGTVGVNANFRAPAYFANFRVTPGSPALEGTVPEPPSAPAGSILNWMVSSPIAEADLVDAAPDAVPGAASLRWTPLEAEESGIVNLARVQGIDGERNTVFARVTVTSDRPQVGKLRFGYSDRIRVYFNGEAVYGGQNNFMSRDYRYLGTIGAFDEVYLPLRQGPNELWLAVSEDFGGWGILAFFEDVPGLTLSAE